MLKKALGENFLYISLIVIGVYINYYFQFNNLDIPNEIKNFYLTLGYPTDPLYWKLISSLMSIHDYPLGHNSINFFTEQLISIFIDNNLVWLSAPLFKIISISIIFMSCKFLFHLDTKQSLFFIFFIFIVLFFNNHTFADRFSRPHITQILIPLSIFLFYLNNIRDFNKKKFLTFYSGSIATLTVFSDPWLSSFILIFYSFFYFLKKQFIDILILILGFIFIIFLIMLFRSFENDIDFDYLLHLEFLGYKNIYSNVEFISDYYMAILSNKYILLSLPVIFLLFFKESRKIILFSAILSIIFGWLPYIIINFNIQPYHTISSLQSFILYLILFGFSEYLSKNTHSIKKISSTSLLSIYIIFLNFDSFNSLMFKRAENIYKDYYEIFNQIDGLDNNCTIISNDIYVRSYVLTYTKNNLRVSEGFFQPRNPDDLIKDASSIVNYLSRINAFDDKKEENLSIKKFVHYGTHNFFSLSSSSAAPSIIKNYNDLLNKVDKNSTFVPWNMNYHNLKMNHDEYLDSKPFIVLRNDYNYFKEISKTKKIDLCT